MFTKNKLYLISGFLTCFLLVGIGSWWFYANNEMELLLNNYPKRKNGGAEISFTRKRPSNWYSLNSISRWLKSAVVISEDWAFYEHSGLDLAQLELVVKDSYEQGKLGRGASTITQQVVKNLFLSSERSLWRKAREIVWALKIEKVLSKQKILEIYLNIVEWGPNIYGIGPASKYYFEKSPRDLTIMESAFLAILLPSPIRYGESFRKKNLTDFAREQIERELVRMRQANILTQEQIDAALLEGISWDAGHTLLGEELVP